LPKGIKPFSEDDKRAVIEVWKVDFPLKTIKDQLGMSERGLRNNSSCARKHPEDPFARKSGRSGRSPKVSLGTIIQIKRESHHHCQESEEGHPTTCHDKLQLPSRKMADKPLINERMNNGRLKFSRQNAHWEVKEWKKVMFNNESHFELRLGYQSFCCRRAKGTDRFDPKFTRKRVKHPPR
jgi:hypothetical protein